MDDIMDMSSTATDNRVEYKEIVVRQDFDKARSFVPSSTNTPAGAYQASLRVTNISESVWTYLRRCGDGYEETGYLAPGKTKGWDALRIPELASFRFLGEVLGDKLHVSLVYRCKVSSEAMELSTDKD